MTENKKTDVLRSIGNSQESVSQTRGGESSHDGKDLLKTGR